MHDFTSSLAARSSEERKTTAPINIVRIARYFLLFSKGVKARHSRLLQSRVWWSVAPRWLRAYLRSPEKRDKMTPVMQMQTRVHSSMNFYGRYILLNEVVGAKNIR